MLLQRLLNWGFIIKDIYGDREVSTFDVIATLQAKGLAYTGTMNPEIPEIREHQEELVVLAVAHEQVNEDRGGEHVFRQCHVLGL